LLVLAASGACSSTGDALFAIKPDAGVIVDTTPPMFGGLMSATADTPYSGQLHFAPATDDHSDASAIVYNAYVAEQAGAEDFTKPRNAMIGTSPAGAPSGLVGGLAPGKTYYIVVRAFDEKGNGDTNMVEQSLTTPTPAAPTRKFGTDIAPLLMANCTDVNQCHGQTAEKNMNFNTAATAYTALMAQALTRPELKRVLPGDSGQSFIVRKILGVLDPFSDGERMPPMTSGYPVLADSDIALIREWIDQGAARN
jgi:hypothetical protein